MQNELKENQMERFTKLTTKQRKIENSYSTMQSKSYNLLTVESVNFGLKHKQTKKKHI